MNTWLLLLILVAIPGGLATLGWAVLGGAVLIAGLIVLFAAALAIAAVVQNPMWLALIAPIAIVGALCVDWKRLLFVEQSVTNNPAPLKVDPPAGDIGTEGREAIAQAFCRPFPTASAARSGTTASLPRA